MIDFYRNAMALKKPRGAILVDGKHVADTLQCVHCSAHWVPIRGSKRRRGWCLSCGGPICGSPKCDICIPLERRLEGWEKKKPLKQVLREIHFKTHYHLFGR